MRSCLEWGVHLRIVDATPPFVTFTTAMGTGRARWAGAEPPVVDRDYDVELSLDVIADGDTTTASPPSVFAIAQDGDALVLQGFVEQVDEDIFYLRLAADALAMIDHAGGLATGDWIALRCASGDVELHPIDY